VLYNKAGTILIACPGSLTTVSIPEGVTSIEWGAFSDCIGLTAISIPASVTSIGAHAFSNCRGLPTISIPQGVTSIGDMAFQYCTGLPTISIPESVTSIGSGAFSDCSGLTTISIPDSVTNISDLTFSYCTGLTNISLPESVTSIGAGAFCGCTGLTTIRFNSATTTIDDDYNTIPATTKIIGYDPSTAKDYATNYNRQFIVGAQISTVPTIANGTVNPSVEITLANDTFTTEFSILINNWTIDTGTTSLTVGAISRTDSTHVEIHFIGTATAGNISILAKLEALTSLVASNSINIVTDTVAMTMRLSLNELINVDSNENQTINNGHSKESSISADGRYVAFTSSASNLVSSDTNNMEDVFVRDRQLGTTVRISVASDGMQGNLGSSKPSISSDGRFIVFESGANSLVSGDTNAVSDIFVRDRDADQDGIFDEQGDPVAVSTIRVSVASDGTQASGGSFWGAGSTRPVISADGRYVKFESCAATLVAGDTNNKYDVFVRDLQNNTTERVSISSAGIQSDDESWYASMSGDGRYVAFSSGSDLLVPGVTDYGIFLRDRLTNTTTWLTSGGDPYLSGNGRFVAFDADDSAALVAGDNNVCYDIFLMDRDTDEDEAFDELGSVSTTRISLSAAGVQPNDSSFGPTISQDGRFVSYYSNASNLVPNDTNDSNDVFIYDRQTGITKCASITITGVQGNEASFEQSVPVSLVDNKKVYVAFPSDADNLVVVDLNNETDIFMTGFDFDALPDTEPPVVPDDLSMEELGPSWVKLAWSPATDNYYIGGYDVYRGTSASGPFSKLATVDSNTTSYWNTTLTPNMDYFYYILAEDLEGNRSTPLPTFLIHTLVESAAAPVAVTLAAGDYHSVAIRAGGTIWSWGENRYGELGNGSDTESLYQVPVLGQYGIGVLDNVAAISAGEYYTVALKTDGTVWAWGKNNRGQLGDGTTDERYTPVPVLGLGGVGFLTGVKAVAASNGDGHTLALRSDGTVWAWGVNYYGELGDGTSNLSSTPVAVKGADGQGYLTDVIAIAAGEEFSLALRSDGTVYAWGKNVSGQLGNGTSDWDDHTLPIQVKNYAGTDFLTGITAIDAGEGFCLALDSSEHAWSWGDNYYGQLGDGTTTTRYLPVQVKDGSEYLTGVSGVAAGSNHSIAIVDNGTATSTWAWGYNYYGQLGNSSTSTSSTPVQIIGIGPVFLLAGGYDHSLALKDDNSIWAWGANYYSQLGYDAGLDEKSELPMVVGESNWAPVVWNVNILGKAVPNQSITGSYTYLDAEGNSDSSTFQWYLSETRDGTYQPVADAVDQSFAVPDSYIGKYLKFEVTPVDSSEVLGRAVTSKFLLVSNDDVGPTLQTPVVSPWSYSAGISVNSNEVGTVYWSVLLSSAQVPDTATVLSGSGALSYGSKDYPTANQDLTFSADNLSSGESYKLYVIAVDDAGNVSVPSCETFTTSSGGA